jgi:hypothetical protein
MDDDVSSLGMGNHHCFRYIATILLAAVYRPSFAAYFVVQQPQANMQWIDNGTNLIQWSKGLGDGITGFDIEMTSKSQDGLLLVAKNGEYCV